MTDKRGLRAALRAARRGFAGTAPLPVPAAFRAGLAPGRVVASYLPMADEPDPAPLEQAAIEAGATLAYPLVVDAATPLRFLLADPGPPGWAEGPFGLRNPPPHWGEAMPDVILTPLLGFDRRGNRLGQGAGHYDRAFAAHPRAWRVGLGWSAQEVAALPADPWDVPLHAVATEREWIVVA